MPSIPVDAASRGIARQYLRGLRTLPALANATDPIFKHLALPLVDDFTHKAAKGSQRALARLDGLMRAADVPARHLYVDERNSERSVAWREPILQRGLIRDTEQRDYALDAHDAVSMWGATAGHRLDGVSTSKVMICSGTGGIAVGFHALGRLVQRRGANDAADVAQAVLDLHDMLLRTPDDLISNVLHHLTHDVLVPGPRGGAWVVTGHAAWTQALRDGPVRGGVIVLFARSYLDEAMLRENDEDHLARWREMLLPSAADRGSAARGALRAGIMLSPPADEEAA